MKAELLKQANDLKARIEQVERDIRNIDNLLTSVTINCRLTGTPENRFNPAIYHYSDKEKISDILKSEKLIKQFELDSLKKVFDLLR